MTVDSTIRGIALAEEQLGALTLGGFLREVCAKYAGNEALVCHAAGRSVLRSTYAEVWAEAWNVARALVARGVGKETRVGLLCTNRSEWISAMFGIALSGGTCVLMSTFSKPAELEYQLRLADVSILIFERAVLDRDLAAELVAICPELADTEGEVQSKKLPFLRRAVCIGDAAPPGAFELWSDFLTKGALAPESLVEGIADQISPTDRGLVFFSSGTTGEPKGIVHAHRAAAIQCWRWRRIFAVDGHVRTWTANGFFWAGNFAMAVGTTFAAGGCLVLQRFFAPGEALRLMQAERVSLPLAWPHQWPQLVEDPAYREVELSSLRYVGEASPLRKHPTVRSDWQEPVAAYGSTETLTLSTAHPSGTEPAFAQGNHGVPLPGNILRIIEPVVDPKTSELDPKAGRAMKRGEFGQIAVKGPTLMLGYLRKPVEDAFDDDGFFRSGDGGFVDEQGRLHWEGRLNDIVKTGGANVSPLEVDQVVSACAGVKLAATVGIPDAKFGELVVTCVVREATAAGEALDESKVRSFASEQLSSYKVPRRVLFILEKELELTATNKPKRGPLRALAAKRLT